VSIYSWVFLLVVFGIVINSVLVQAAQPSLPTVFYGKVVNPDSTPAEGVEVTAFWPDSNGVENERIVKTFTTEANAGFGGYYFFNNGFIDAVDGSMVGIDVGDISREFDADPGGDPVLLETINLGDKSVPKGESAPLSTSSYSEGSGSGSGQGTPSQGSGAGDAGLDGLPMSVYGQLTDDEGNPLEGVDVTAEWADESGEWTKKSTSTLTKQEAAELGNSSLAGFYSFNIGGDSPPNTTVLLEPTDRQSNSSVTVNPGESVRSNILYSRDETPEKVIDKGKNPIEVKNIVHSSKEFVVDVGEKAKHSINYVLIFGVMVAVILVIGAKRLVGGKVKELGEGLAMGGLRSSLNKLAKMRVSEFMSKDVIICSLDTDLGSIIRSMLSANVNSVLVVRDGKAVGVVTQGDVIKAVDLNNADLDAVKAKDAMTEPVKSILPGSTFVDAVAFSLDNNTRVMPVSKNNKLLGVVTQTDLLREFDGFFSENVFEGENLPRVKESMVEEVWVLDKGDKLSELFDELKVSDIDCALVVEFNRWKSKSISRTVGIITKRDIVSELHSNPDFVKKLIVGNVGSKKVISVTPGVDVFEACKLMVNKECRRLPVIENNVPTGVVTEREVIKALNEFYGSLLDDKLKDSVSASK